MEQSSDKFAIHEACREGKISIVESLLNANPRLAKRRDDDERLPIHWAVSYNQRAIVELLVQAKDFDVDAQDEIGWTSLMMASSLKEGEDIVELLLKKGADPKMTTIHFAASKNNLDTARKLIAAGATSRIKDKRQQTPLHRAAAIGSIPMMKLLMENKSPLDATDLDGMTAWHHAVCEGHGDAAMVLLKAGADAVKRTKDGVLAIDLAPDEKVKSFIVKSAEMEGIEVYPPSEE
ncbi:ankyrin [Aulographum hederae CBS 113979]|uniref:Ankyrin n=1 Tax=Aulographum hederae CBS 113979 TaxID=1176131 RepID=A0A6G1H8M2_9PEZI|nr:ankyrin [Aulographum hederae CBS 113979]